MNPWYTSKAYRQANLLVLSVCTGIVVILQIIQSARTHCGGARPLGSFGECATSERCAASGCVSMRCYGQAMCLPDVTEACFFADQYFAPGQCPSYDATWEGYAKLFLSSISAMGITVFLATRIVICRSKAAHEEQWEKLVPEEGGCPACGGHGIQDRDTLRRCEVCSGGGGFPGEEEGLI